MMRAHFLTLLILSLISISAFSQEVRLSEKDCDGLEKPQVLLKGEIVNSECDSIFLVNPVRMKLYKEAVGLVLEMDTSLFEKEFRELENVLNKLSERGLRMQGDYDALERSYRESLDEQEEALDVTRTELNVAEADLRKERERINLIREDLDKARKDSGRKSFLYGAGGLAVGFIGAALIFN